MFIAVFSAASIVWDREFGFLREMMVAPVRRSSLVLGKCLGGASVAAFEGVILIGLAGLVHVPYAPILILEIFGPAAAAGVRDHRVRRDGGRPRCAQMQSFMALTQMFIMPMFFLSGAMFPVSGLPDLARGAEPDRSAHLRRRPDASRRSSRICTSVPCQARARPRRHVVRLAGTGPARGGSRRDPRAS